MIGIFTDKAIAAMATANDTTATEIEYAWFMKATKMDCTKRMIDAAIMITYGTCCGSNSDATLIIQMVREADNDSNPTETVWES